MARPPAGPQGNSPRDVRDDAVGVPAENVTAPEPPRWPPKRKKITKDTFHAKVSGKTSGKRADRPPTFRRGGMVRGFASGGSVKPEDKPGEQKNDPSAKLKRGGVAKRQEGGPAGPSPDDRKEGIEKLGRAMGREQSFAPGRAGPFNNPRTYSSNISRYVRPGLKEEAGGFKKGGPVAKAGRFQFGGMSGRPPGQLRSEMTEAEKGRRTLQRTPPVTIMEDAIGALSEGKAQSNAVRDAIRRGAADKIKESGYEQENKGFGHGYDFKKTGGAVKKRQGGGTTPPPEPVPVISDVVVPGTGGGGFGPGGDEQDVGRKKYTDVPRYGDFNRGGAVKKRQMGGSFEPRGGWKPPDKPMSWPSDLKPVGAPLDLSPPPGKIGPPEPHTVEDKYAGARAKGRRQGQEMLRDMRLEREGRSESTERARALGRLEGDQKERQREGFGRIGNTTRDPDERMEDVKIIERAGPQFKKGGKVK